MSDIFYVFKIPDAFIDSLTRQTGTKTVRAACNVLWEDRRRIERIGHTIGTDYRDDIRTDGVDPRVDPWIWSTISKFYNPEHFGENNLPVFNIEWLERFEEAFADRPPLLRVGCTIIARPAYIEHNGRRYDLRFDQREWRGIYIKQPQFMPRTFDEGEYPSPAIALETTEVAYDIIRFGFSATEMIYSHTLGKELRKMYDEAARQVATGVYCEVKDVQ